MNYSFFNVEVLLPRHGEPFLCRFCLAFHDEGLPAFLSSEGWLIDFKGFISPPKVYQENSRKPVRAAYASDAFLEELSKQWKTNPVLVEKFSHLKTFNPPPAHEYIAPVEYDEVETAHEL
jgi:hypothetical protein